MSFTLRVVAKNILLLYMYNRGMSEGRKKKKDPFREAFSRVKDLRSQLPGVPVIALTASVLLKERQKLIKASGMISPVIVDVSPNKENITLDFLEMKKESYSGSNLKWVADMISTHGRQTPQTIIFCKTFNSISFVLSYLLMTLRGQAFVDSEDKGKVSLIGVYHAKTWDKEKSEIEHDFKGDGLKRVVIATCALGMGVNFPHVRYVIQYAPPNSLVDLMQEAGRGGRDGLQAHCVVYYTRQQLSQCSKDVKMVVNSEGCQRKELYGYFSDSDVSVEPGHKCCSNCRKDCKCGGDKCEDQQSFLAADGETPSPPDPVRELSETDLLDLRLSLEELQQQYSACGPSLFHAESTHGFSDQLIGNILKHAPNISSAEYMSQHLSMFSSKHIMDVLEVFQELFEDVNNYDEQMEQLNLIHHEVCQVEDYFLMSTTSQELSEMDELMEDTFEDYHQLQEFELVF